MMTNFSSTRFVKKYLTGIALVLCLIVFSIFLGFYYKTNTLIRDQLHSQGQAFFVEILLTRKWIANHGGVYVKLTPDMEVNPYLLKVPGLKVTVTDGDGERYVLKNPALATREISALAAKEGLFTFHITSLNPLNPNNIADAFEREALSRFEEGLKEYSLFVKNGEEVVFRYMAPLVTEKTCLRCHHTQGYQEGDIRGGISVSIPATAMMRQMDVNRFWLILSALGVVCLVVGIIAYISRVFIRNLSLAESRLLDMASKDFLTDLLNRREAYNRLVSESARADRTGTTIGIMLLDIDHFKKINDIHGHSVGDLVLQTLAAGMRKEMREYDILCRFGGEEFLVVVPDTEKQCVQTVAERLRKSIAGIEIPIPKGGELSITVSIGTTKRRSGENVDEAIARADAALYRAKAAGRNCVVSDPENPRETRS